MRLRVVSRRDAPHRGRGRGGKRGYINGGRPENKNIIDSRFRKDSSPSSSDFTFELVRSINLPRKCAAFIADVAIPHTWYNIDANNCNLYYVEGQIGNLVTPVGVLKLDAGNYTGTSLATAIHDGLNAGSSVSETTLRVTTPPPGQSRSQHHR